MVTHTLLLASSHALSLTKFTLSRRLTSRNGGREGHKRGSDGDNYHCWCVNRMPALSVRTLMSKTATGQSVAVCDLCETRRYAGCEWTLKSESECTLTKARIESHANWTATRVVECYRDTSNGAANMCDENLCSTHENTKNKKLYNRTARRTVSVKFCQRLTEWTNCIKNQKQNQSNTVKTTLRRTCMRVQPRRVDCRNCGQQARPSTTFADNTIDLQAKFSAFRVWDKKMYIAFEDTRISL